MRTEVAITVDVEFSIAGAFEDFTHSKPIAEPVVECPVNGKSEGLGFLLETFASYDIPATFFVETLNYRYFGDAPMARICHHILEAKQDIQLHIHPVWMAFDQGRLLPGERNDFCAGRSVESLKTLFTLGVEALHRWRVPPPVALRTGSLSVDHTVYDAMDALCLPLASNVGLGVHRPTDSTFCLANGRHRIGTVTELPVTSYKDLSIFKPNHYRPLQVTACSWPEIRTVLWAAHEKKLENIVILTHPFEYIKTKSFRYTHLARNRVTQQRVENLCSFLKENHRYFTPVSFGSQVSEWSRRDTQNEIPLAMPLWRTFFRMAENGLNDRIQSF